MLTSPARSARLSWTILPPQGATAAVQRGRMLRDSGKDIAGQPLRFIRASLLDGGPRPLERGVRFAALAPIRHRSIPVAPPGIKTNRACPGQAGRANRDDVAEAIPDGSGGFRPVFARPQAAIGFSHHESPKRCRDRAGRAEGGFVGELFMGVHRCRG